MVRAVNRHMAETKPVDGVQLSTTDPMWRHRTKAKRLARRLGRLELKDGPEVAFVLFRGDELMGCRLQSESKFLEEYEPCSDAPPDWDTIAGRLANDVA